MTITTAVVGEGARARTVWEVLGRCHAYDLIGPVHRVPGTPGAPGHAANRRAWEELLARRDVSLIVLSVADRGRMELIASAQEAGKAVVVAGPPPLSLAELNTLAVGGATRGGRTASPMPMRMLLPTVPELSRSAWTGSACGVLTLSRFTPVQASRAAAETASDPTGLPAITRVLAPYVDVVCHLFGHPVAAHFMARGDGTATGCVEFESGSLLALAVTLTSAWEHDRLELMDVTKRVVWEDGHLQVHSPEGSRLLRLPAPGDLLVSAYADIAARLGADAPLHLHGPEAGRGVALFLHLLGDGRRDTDRPLGRLTF
ncbi:hypothetical protein [Streptomyces sp. NPDC091259]|uniref:hypothetical protein n=1 Tax=Streptomyces sp. NPDC091259 TaxID=3365976 RepID=UPI0037F76251